MKGPDRQAMERLLSKVPPYALVEYPAPSSVFGDRLRQAVDRHGLFLSLTTKTAFNADVTGLLCAVCKGRLPLSDERRFDIETAVEEALSNAMVHGNLDVASSLRNDPADFEIYCDLVNERLQTPGYADRRIEILILWDTNRIDIEVHDEGRGYDFANVRLAAPLEAKSGRGFALIMNLANSVSVGEQGRCLTMSFRQ